MGRDSMRKSGHQMKGEGRRGGHGCPIAGKVAKKSHMILENSQALGLTDEQVKTVKDLATKTEKDNIQSEAAMKTFQLDLKSKLQEDKVDVEGTNALIDKNTAAMAQAMKANVEAYAKLKAVLTPEQHQKLKALKGKEHEEKRAA